MANRTDTFTTRIFLNDKQAKDTIANLEKETKRIRKEMNDAAKDASKTGDWSKFNKLKGDLDLTTKHLNAMRTSAQQVSHVLENLSGASIKEIRNTIKAINKELSSGNIERGTDKWNFLNEALRNCKEELKKIRDESAVLTEQEDKSSFWKKLANINQIGFAVTNFFGLEDGISGIISKVQLLAQESMEVAKNAEGIELAFNRINKPGLLDNLRKATHGTIDDIQLMQQAVKFQNFNLPVEQLGKLLAFAQQTAKDTGESIDYMTNSIVDGLTRQSPKILDNLGLSAQKIKEKTAETGDFVQGVISIVDERMKEMGDYTETAADRAARATANVTNAQMELGKQLLPVRSQLAGVFGRVKLGMLEALTWILKNRDAFVLLAKAVGVWTVVMLTATSADKAAVVSQKIHAAVTAINTARTNAWTAATTFLRSALVAVRLVVALCTGGVNAYTAALERAKAASMTNPWTALATVLLTVGTAVYALVKHLQNEKESAKKAADATNIFLLNQKNMQAVTKEANAKVSEEVTRLNTLYLKLKDSKTAYNERKQALSEIQKMVPSYHGALTKEGQLINDNVGVLKDYCNNLVKAARAQAAFNKMVKIQDQALNHQTLLEGRQNNQKWVLQEMAKYGYDPTQGDEFRYLVGQGVYVRDRYGNKKSDKALTDAQVDRLNSLQKAYDYNVKRTNEENKALNLLQQQTKELEKQVNVAATSTSGSTGGQVSSSDSGSVSGGGGTSNGSAGGGGNDSLEDRLKKQEDSITKSAEHEQIMLTLQYRQGLITYTDYLTKQEDITKQSLARRVQLYVANNATTLDAYYEALKAQSDYEDEQQNKENKKNETAIEQWRLNEVYSANQAFRDVTSVVFNDQNKLNDRLFEIGQQALNKRLALYKEGSKEYEEINQKLEDNEKDHQSKLQEEWAKTIDNIKKKYQSLSLDEQEAQDTALLNNALEYIRKQYDAKLKELKNKGYDEDSEEYQKLKKELEAIETQYQEWLINTQTEYARKRIAQRSQEQKDEQSNEHMSDAAARGFDKAGLSDSPIMSSSGFEGLQGFVGVAGTVATAIDAFSKLRDAKKNDLINDEEWKAAKEQLWKELWHNLPDMAMAAFSTIQTFMQADAAYTQANCDYKVAMITKQYDQQIERAGNNSAKVEKLEKDRDKKIAAERTKANKKAMKVEVAQALASTAMAAINAYSSAAKVPLIGYILAPIAAAAALAYGTIQIATIKKQHQAQEAGYYEGGFTGGSSYRREAGVVHEGEFVANHQAVNNPQLLPAFRLLDQAQRNNTVGSLTAADVSRSMGAGGTAIAYSPQINVTNDNSDIAGTLQQARATIDSLGALLASGQIIVRMPDWDDFDRSREHWERIKGNK